MTPVCWGGLTCQFFFISKNKDIIYLRKGDMELMQLGAMAQGLFCSPFIEHHNTIGVYISALSRLSLHRWY